MAKQDFLKNLIVHQPKTPMEVPLRVDLLFFFRRPKSHFNKKGLKKDAPKFHTKKPDIDNLIKFVLDALNKVFWKDDSQVVFVCAEKLYNDREGIRILIEEAIP